MMDKVIRKGRFESKIGGRGGGRSGGRYESSSHLYIHRYILLIITKDETNYLNYLLIFDNN